MHRGAVASRNPGNNRDPAARENDRGREERPLARGTFPATFLLACLAALELEGGDAGGYIVARMRRGIPAIALLLALCGQAPAEPGSWRLEPPIPSLGNTNQIAKPEAERRKNGPASDPKVALPGADNPSAGTNKSEGFDYTSADWWVAAFTLLLAVIAVGQLIVFGMQARRLRQTVEAMKEAESRQSRDTKDLLAATKDAALAAKQSAAVAEKTMALNDRPWIGFSVGSAVL